MIHVPGNATLLMLMTHLPEIGVKKPVAENEYRFLTHLTCSLVGTELFWYQLPVTATERRSP